MSELDPLQTLVEQDSPKAVRAAKAAAAEAAALKRETYNIIIDEVEGLPGYEFVGVNGEGFQIQRGVPVSVPARVVEALKNAITTAYRKTPHPTEPGKYDMVPYQRATIPWRFA